MPIRVLVVDDDADFQWLIGWAVQTERDTEVVGVAEDGESGVAAALREQPDVVVMDLMMPQTDGFEATTRIKQSQPALKVLAVTSWSIDTAMRQKLHHSGVDAAFAHLHADCFRGHRRRLSLGLASAASSLASTFSVSGAPPTPHLARPTSSGSTVRPLVIFSLVCLPHHGRRGRIRGRRAASRGRQAIPSASDLHQRVAEFAKGLLHAPSWRMAGGESSRAGRRVLMCEAEAAIDVCWGARRRPRRMLHARAGECYTPGRKYAAPPEVVTSRQVGEPCPRPAFRVIVPRSPARQFRRDYPAL